MQDNVSTAPKTVYLNDYQPPAYRVESIRLDFNLHETQTRVTATMQFARNPDSKADSTLRLDGHALQLHGIWLDGRELAEHEYQHDNEHLHIDNVPSRFELQVENSINPQDNKALEGLYLSSGMFCTQCEAEGFRRITFFPDRPDVMSLYEVRIEADKTKYPVLLSNGNLVEQGELDDNRHYAIWQDPSLKPSYLFALVAGDLHCQQDSFTTLSGRKVDLRIYVEHENSHKCDHAMASLKQAMQWDEQVYGREYDLDIYMIVAVNDFNMGAMENKGLNIFNASCVLASADTATDADYYNIQSIIAHEYFHNWSGNRVTCRDWFQLSLKEGFTVFRDQEFSADLNSRAVKRIDDVNVLRTHQFAQDAGPMAHPVRPDHYIEISNFYTVTVYNKGAEVVRMIRNLVGADGFRKGTDLYFERHDGEAVTTEDFVRAMEDANDVDLSQFQRWYSQPGTPIVKVNQHYNAESQTFTLELEQLQPNIAAAKDNQPFHIPLQLGLLDSKGNAMPLYLDGHVDSGRDSLTLELREQKEQFVFQQVDATPVVSINRGFTAPVKVDLCRSREELVFLFSHDSDAFNRWDAGQTLAIQTLQQLVDAIQQQQPLQLDKAVIDAFRATLTDTALDKALIAQAMTLPSENYLADQYETVDVDAIHQAREFMRKQLATALQNELWEVLKNCETKGKYRFHAEDMAQRDLHKVCLSYLMCLQDKTIMQYCHKQLQQADNMTDELSALTQLAQYDTSLRQPALDAFYQKWQHDAQVVEKWLAIQSGANLPNVLDEVKGLMQHAAFSITNPNKVRALIGRFAGNTVHFHAADGRGYAFVAEQVMQLDSMNPQIAARLVQVFSRWRRYDENRQRMMQQQLETILAKPDLSRDVYEIVSRSLETAT